MENHSLSRPSWKDQKWVRLPDVHKSSASKAGNICGPALGLCGDEQVIEASLAKPRSSGRLWLKVRWRVSECDTWNWLWHVTSARHIHLFHTYLTTTPSPTPFSTEHRQKGTHHYLTAVTQIFTSPSLFPSWVNLLLVSSREWERGKSCYQKEAEGKYGFVLALICLV